MKNPAQWVQHTRSHLAFFMWSSPRPHSHLHTTCSPQPDPCILSAGSHPSRVRLLVFLPTCSWGSTRAPRMIKQPIGGQDGPCTQTHAAGRPHSLSLVFSLWEDKDGSQTSRDKVQLIYYTPARGSQAVTNSLLLWSLCCVAREWAEHSDPGQTLDKTKPRFVEDSQSMKRLAD